METYPCPSCDNAGHNTAPTPVTDVLLKVIGTLLLHCSVCRETVQLEQLNNHLKSERSTVPSPSKLKVGQILCRPTDAPTATEKKVATSVVKRLLHTSDSEVVSLPTAGQVHLYTISIGECIINYLQYQTVGKGTLKNAKNHNNVIGKVFLIVYFLRYVHVHIVTQ